MGVGNDCPKQDYASCQTPCPRRDMGASSSKAKRLSKARRRARRQSFVQQLEHVTQTVHATVVVPPKGTHSSRALAATPADAVAATTATAIVPWSTGSHNSAAVERARALAARQLARQGKPLTKADLLQCLWFVTQAANLASLHANVSQTCTAEEIRMMLRAMLWDPRNVQRVHASRQQKHDTQGEQRSTHHPHRVITL